MLIPHKCAWHLSLVSPSTPNKTMSKDVKTLAVMIANRAADIEATEELKKKDRLGLALEAFCNALKNSVDEQTAEEEL